MNCSIILFLHVAHCNSTSSPYKLTSLRSSKAIGHTIFATQRSQISQIIFTHQCQCQTYKLNCQCPIPERNDASLEWYLNLNNKRKEEARNPVAAVVKKFKNLHRSRSQLIIWIEEREWKREKNLQAQKALPDPNALKRNAYPKTRKSYGNQKFSFTHPSSERKRKEKKSLD